jgi:hypothetical protein
MEDEDEDEVKWIQIRLEVPADKVDEVVDTIDRLLDSGAIQDLIIGSYEDHTGGDLAFSKTECQEEP